MAHPTLFLGRSRRWLLPVALLLATALGARAQSGTIGICTTTPYPSAALDVSRTGKGLLPPRMSEGQRAGIGAPAAGLTIYNTTTTNRLNVWNGTAWTEMLTYRRPADVHRAGRRDQCVRDGHWLGRCP